MKIRNIVTAELVEFISGIFYVKRNQQDEAIAINIEPEMVSILLNTPQFFNYRNLDEWHKPEKQFRYFVTHEEIGRLFTSNRELFLYADAQLSLVPIDGGSLIYYNSTEDVFVPYIDPTKQEERP